MEPLRGVRIVEATGNASGPMATAMLADQGADVIRLEPMGTGDPSRHVGGVRAPIGIGGAAHRDEFPCAPTHQRRACHTAAMHDIGVV